MLTTLTPQERQTAATELRRAGDALIALARSVPAEMWKRNPAAGGWSPAEICEHVWRVNRGVLVLLKRTRESEEPAPEIAGLEDRMARVRSREGRGQAPEATRPAGVFGSAEEFVASFEESVAALCAYASTTEDALHRRIAPHVALGPLDGYQWLLFLAAHCERHVEQCKEAMAAGQNPT